MAETILGAVLDVVFDRLASKQVLDFFKASKLDQSLVNKLKHLMQVTEKLLADAEQKQFTESAVNLWLTDLKHLFYQAEDIADEIATEALRSSLDLPPEPESFGTKVRNWIPSFSSSSSSFASSVNSKMSEVVTRLDDMVTRSAALNLREGSVNTAFRNRESTSYFPSEDSQVFGRDQDKEKLLDSLFSEEAEKNRINVVAIVGMGGMGKTTLAKLVYNDGSLGSFDLNAWVYVSEQFDISRVTKSILQSITCQSYSDSFELEFLCRELRGKLKDKRFFLVLDDVWNENPENWKSLWDQLTVGAHGSKIIVTTRNEDVASIMRTVPVIRLRPLLDEDGWSLFSKHAFEVGNMNSNQHLEPLGRKIVEKCGGLPLAIKTLGGLLRSKEGINVWEAILQSSLWDLPDNKSNVAPALWLSYYHLPSHLKRCFSYCAVFPKGYKFDRKTLVLLWMAENFVQPADTGRRIEAVGEEYLSQLLSRSFFDKSENCVVMHDLMHDLAQVVSGEFFARQEDGETAAKVPEKARYFSYLQDEYDVFTKFEGLLASKYLRTFIPWQSRDIYHMTIRYHHLSSTISAVMIPQFYSLRVLSLSSYEGLKLPESIENLKQLRYLDVSRTKIKELPESVSSLCNLQTLLLSDCRFLERLPGDMSRLVSLRHLDISETTSLGQMPKHMSKLKCLQTLSGFVVSKHCDRGIEELRELVHIRGRLALRSLQNVSSPMGALEANLSCRKHIDNVAFEFDEKESDDSLKGREVVENLKPHTNLKRLTIRNYPGTQFPSWLGTQCLMYKSIVDLQLKGCKYCCLLPPLGQLRRLRFLEIVGMEYVVTIGSEFYAYDSVDINPFPVLRLLIMKDMKIWKEWCGHEIEGRLPFPCLEELWLENCPELEGDLPANLDALKVLTIQECGSLRRLPATRTSTSIELVSLPPQLTLLSSLKTIILHGLEKLNSLENMILPTNLQCLDISRCKMLVSLPPRLALVSCLETLCLRDLEMLESLENVRLPTNLRSLDIDGCKMLVSLPPRLALLSCLQDLNLCNLEKLESLENVRLPTNLQYLQLRGCKMLECLPKELDLLNHLQTIDIWGCPTLKWAPEDTLPASLQCLFVASRERCEFPISVLGESMQRYSSLRTLSISGTGGRLVSFPLGAFPNLQNLLLRNLRDLETVYIPRGSGTDLVNLTSLQKLSIENCPELKWIGKTEEDGVVDLPTPNLIQLTISGCGILKPMTGGREGGLPSKLQELCVEDDFNKARNPRSLLMFSCLRTLTIRGYDGEYFPDNRVSLPITIRDLTLWNFPNLKNLNGEAINTLTSLCVLYIDNCPNLQCLPHEGLPSSLGFLRIERCPFLKKRCKKNKGPDWPKIEHIPRHRGL